LPALKRLDETVKELSFYLFCKYRHEVSTKERKEIQRSIYGMFLSLNISALYRYFYKWCGRPELFKMASKGRWEYLDIFGLAYLKICIEGIIPKCPLAGMQKLHMDTITNFGYPISTIHM
jgi:DNA helicase-2/ATP-dependent DNA helicase PcrA